VQRRVLITGAGGFIGRWSVPALHARGFEVHALEHAAQADLRDPRAIDALLAQLRPTHLLHFAWIATPGVYWNSPENERWLQAGTHLARGFFAAGGRRAVMAGSCAEYDWSRAGVCSEFATALADAAGPAPSAYAAAKLALSRRLTALGQAAGVPTAWGRIFFQFGPGEHPARLVPGVVQSLLAGREALCTAGTQVRSFLHAADVGEAFAALLDSEVEGAVNIGSAERVSVAALVGAIAAQLGRGDLVRLGARPMPPGEPALLLPDVTRLREELGWRPRFTLQTALADTIAWWRAQ
jgi:nucleoside-diphosphate-sugar epimerase